MEQTVLELRNISKSFGGVKALENVDFDLREGEVHGLVGENGAGKSTLMKILAGVHTDYEGELRLRDRLVRFGSPKSAKNHGIGMIYQELSSIPALTVAENLCLGDQPRNRFGFVDWRSMYARGRAHLTELGIDVDVRRPVEELSLGYQQLIEIARVTHSGADILIMDEPTSALSPSEVERLFEIIQTLKQKKKSIIFISHFLEDILRISDRVTIFRNGRKVTTLTNDGLAKHQLVEHMLGESAKSLEESYEKEFTLKSDAAAPVMLEVRGAKKGTRLAGIDLTLREGEILGLYGAMGAGHSLFGECLYGLKGFDAGEVFLDGRPLRPAPCHRMKPRGIAYVSSDRTASLFLDAEIYKNVSIAFLKQLVSVPVRKDKEVRLADEMVQKLRVKTSSSLALLRNLSGGNQQKVALARWLVHPIRLLILNEPTRGMDVGAKEEVMNIVKGLKQQKVAVLLISSEPETIIANSDRVLVMSKGRITAEFVNEAVSKDKLLRCA